MKVKSRMVLTYLKTLTLTRVRRKQERMRLVRNQWTWMMKAMKGKRAKKMRLRRQILRMRCN